MLDRNPVFWLAMRPKPNAAPAWGIAALGIVGPVGVLTMGSWNHLFSPALALSSFFFVNAALKTFVAGQAAAALARDRAEDPLELLLSTPLTAKRLIEGQWLFLRQTLKPLVQLVLWIEIAWMTLTIAFDALDRSGMTFVYVSGSVAVVGFLVPDLRAIGWTGLWRGVIARNAREAEQQAFSQVAFLPWLPVFITWVAVASTANPFPAWFASIVCWVLCSLLADQWFGRRSRRLLETRLTLWAGRRAAGEFENYDGWRAAGRWLGRRWRALQPQ